VAVGRPSVPATGPEEEGPLESPQWQRYPSINDVDLDQVDEIRRAVRGSDIEFVAVEKVHGSNFAFETDGRSIDYFSRSRRLEKHGRFVGKTAPAEAMRQYHAAVRETFRVCASRTAQGVKSVVVYGEYFGGWYPHPQVEQEGPGAGVPVQKGIVAYAPSHYFFAFDVCVDGRFLDFDDATGVLTSAGFQLVARPVVRGSFEQCMDFDVESFQTGVPGLLGLPPCQAYCIAEGLVIRPVQRRASWTVKRKSVRYLEAVPDELRKWLNKCVQSKEEAFAGLYLCLCQQPRLEAVLSKDPQLRAAGALSWVQELYRRDVDECFEKRLQRIGSAVPRGCLQAARAEADRRVAAWLLGSERSVATAGGA